MRKISPKCSNTIICNDPHEWKPSNFDDFLKELEHIKSSCPRNNPLFRGHAESKWLLESTFVRNCKKILLGLESYIKPSKEIRKSVEYHQALFGLLLLKYDILVKPNQELEILEKEQGIDALFELIKRLQQYPEEDECVLKGTFFLDWTQSKNVGLFFTNFDANEQEVKMRDCDGALFICDKTATGNTHMRRDDQPIRVQKIIELMCERNNKVNQGFGCPLLFYPPKQIHNLRANRQDAIYWAQMDLRHDLEDIWKLHEKDKNEDEYIFIKLILPDGTQKECEDYLNSQSPSITHKYLFPEENISHKSQQIST